MTFLTDLKLHDKKRIATTQLSVNWIFLKEMVNSKWSLDKAHVFLTPCSDQLFTGTL